MNKPEKGPEGLSDSKEFQRSKLEINLREVLMKRKDG
jgi:hypothetical protein